MTRRRQLTDEEEALWRGVARSIKPLRPPKAKPPMRPAPAAAETKRSLQRTAKPHPAPELSPARRQPQLAPLDRREKKRVARGRDAIDARIDLHGMTQGEAHDALVGFVRRAQRDGARLVLVVTGKGSRTSRDADRERGVLRRQVPLWLALPEFRPFIVGFDAAHLTHGGEGALYVRLRRTR